MTPVARDLAERLEQKIDRLSEAVGELRTIAARIETTQEQAHAAINAGVLRADKHEERIGLLERDHSRAQGAAWAFRAVLVAAMGAAEWFLHR